MKHTSLPLAALFIAGTVFSASADISISQIRTTENLKDGKIDGTPKTEASTLWISADKVRMDGEAESVLLAAGKDSVYMIDNKKKTYTGISLTQLSASAATKDEMPPEMAAMMGSMMKIEVAITPTAETKTINNWKCTKYLQTVKMMGTTTSSELWATTDLTIDASVMKKFASSIYLKSQALKDMAAQMQKESEKVKGIVVYSVSTTEAMGKTSRMTSEMRDMKEGSAPAGTWEIPAKYKAKPLQ